MQNRSTGKGMRKESNEWLGEESNEQEGFALGKAEKLLDCQKHSPKEQRTSPVQKTQRIKKPKKQERKTTNREQHPIRPEAQTLEGRLVCQSVNRLRAYQSTQRDQTLPIFKRLTRERLIDFLEIIQQQYSQTAKSYLSNASNQKSCGNLKSLFICFIDQIAQAFPVLNNIVYQYAFRYYATGPLQYRFSKLMEKNITPILKIMSEKYNKVEKKVEIEKEVDLQSSSTHVSQSPEREHLEEFQEIDAKKMEKRRKKRNKKKEKQGEESVEKEVEVVVQPQQKPTKVEIDRNVIQLNNFLDQLTIDDTIRTPCRIDQSYLTRWKPPKPQSLLP